MTPSRFRALSAPVLVLVLFVLGLFPAPSSSARADSWEGLTNRGVVRWANDAEGGAPYIFHPADDASKLVGFEVEFAEALCSRLGLRSEFVQYNWANLIPGLRQGGNFDIVVAALERTP